jgi:uncharacterized membrane protein YeaQ/YmgE (transglycosylase-associated protein family)
MAMVSILWEWIAVPLVGAIVGEALLRLLRGKGYYPDRWLAELVLSRRPKHGERITHSILVAGAALAGLLLGFWIQSHSASGVPASAGNTIGDIKGNKGIITQGQTGDNTISK